MHPKYEEEMILQKNTGIHKILGIEKKWGKHWIRALFLIGMHCENLGVNGLKYWISVEAALSQ